MKGFSISERRAGISLKFLLMVLGLGVFGASSLTSQSGSAKVPVRLIHERRQGQLSVSWVFAFGSAATGKQVRVAQELLNSKVASIQAVLGDQFGVSASLSLDASVITATLDPADLPVLIKNVAIISKRVTVLEKPAMKTRFTAPSSAYDFLAFPEDHPYFSALHFEKVVAIQDVRDAAAKNPLASPILVTVVGPVARKEVEKLTPTGSLTAVPPQPKLEKFVLKRDSTPGSGQDLRSYAWALDTSSKASLECSIAGFETLKSSIGKKFPAAMWRRTFGLRGSIIWLDLPAKSGEKENALTAELELVSIQPSWPNPPAQNNEQRSIELGEHWYLFGQADFPSSKSDWSMCPRFSLKPSEALTLLSSKKSSYA